MSYKNAFRFASLYKAVAHILAMNSLVERELTTFVGMSSDNFALTRMGDIDTQIGCTFKNFHWISETRLRWRGN